MAPKKKNPAEEQPAVNELNPVGEAMTEPEEEMVTSAIAVDADQFLADLGIDEEDAATEIPAERPSTRPARPMPNAASAMSSVSRVTSRTYANDKNRTSIAEQAAIEAERMQGWEEISEDSTTLSIFQTAMKEKRILEGRIAGVEATRRGAYWVLYEGPVTVRIPFDNSYMTIPADLVGKRPTDSTIQRQRQMLDRAKGAVISFTVSDIKPMDDGAYLAIGSRTDALNKIRKVYFGSRATYPMEKGKDYRAQILSNGEHAAYLTVAGIDIRVKKSELTHKFIQDITSTFHVGEFITVRVMEIEQAKDANSLPVVSVSAKPIERERFKRNINRIQQNGTYLGTVVSVNRKNSPDGSTITISLFLDEVGVPAYSRTTILDLGNSIHQGDKVSFLATGIHKNEGLAHGKILEVIKPRI